MRRGRKDGERESKQHLLARHFEAKRRRSHDPNTPEGIKQPDDTHGRALQPETLRPEPLASRIEQGFVNQMRRFDSVASPYGSSATSSAGYAPTSCALRASVNRPRPRRKMK